MSPGRRASWSHCSCLHPAAPLRLCVRLAAGRPFQRRKAAHAASCYNCVGGERSKMNRVAGPVHGLPGRTAAGAETAACNLFGLLWEGLADLLGTAATATLLRRAALRGAARNADLAG